MNQALTTQGDRQVLDVLIYMASNVKDRPMLHDLLNSDIERWPKLGPNEQLATFERNTRRFAVVCPAKAQRERVILAREALHRQLSSTS